MGSVPSPSEDSHGARLTNWPERASEMNPEGFAGANGLSQIPKNETEKAKHGDI